MTALHEAEKFIAETHTNRALAFWGNNSFAIYRLIEELDHEAGKWITPIDEDAISEAVKFLKDAQIIMYKRYRDYISKKIEIISGELGKEDIPHEILS